MRDKLFSLPGVESGEESMVSTLLTQSVFLGVFLGAFDISAHSLFLAVFDEKMMARGYVISGIAGIMLTSFYAWIKTRLQVKNFAVFNLLAVTSLTFFLWIGLIFTPAKWMILIVFIMLGPLNILAMLGFRETTDRLFTLRQGKRLSGLMDTGLIIGIIISCYSIPGLLSFKFTLHNILLISAASVLTAAVIQILIGARFPMINGSVEQQPEKYEEKKSVLTLFRADPYIRIVGIFMALSVISAFFVQYSFMAVTREQYPAEVDMARFLGIFTGSLMIFTLLLKKLVFSYLIRNFGLRTCLAISPILIAVFTASAIATGLFFGYKPASGSGFLIFFILLALSRLFSRSLKESIESSSFKVIYQTIDEKVRYKIRSGINGTLNEIVVLTSGIILTGLGILSFIKLIHFSLVLVFIVLIWAFVAFRLYKEYRKSITKALEADVHGRSDTSEQKPELKNKFSADQTFRSDYFGLISGDFSMLGKNGNRLYFKKIIDYAGSKQDISLIPVLNKISLDNSVDEEIRQQSVEMVRDLKSLLTSRKQDDKRIAHAKKILSGTRLPQTTEILRLLRDYSLESKKLAILMVGKFKLTDMLPEVCECLNIPGLETDAYAVLRSFDSLAVDELERYYLVSSGNTNTSKTILRLLSKTNSKESKGFLFSRVWSNSRQLKEVAVKGLIDCNFKPAEEDKDRLNKYISDIAGIMTWNLSAKICLEKNNVTFLSEVVKKEMLRWNRFLFNILSITYDPGSISKIRENLESETVESVNNALEMIDIVIDDSIKPQLISLLDIVPDEDKLKNLYLFFPGEVPGYNKLIEDIINRDYNLISLWTKACALRNLTEIEGDELAESVVALLFSPEPIMQEESAKLIARSSRELYKAVSQRIPDSTKVRLDRIVNGESDDMELLFEKIRFLSDCFKGIPEEELLTMAGALKYIRDLKTEFPTYPYGCLIWSLSDEKQISEVYVNYTEQMNSSGEKFKGRDNTSYFILSLSAVEEYLYQFPDRWFEIMKYIDNKEELPGFNLAIGTKD